MRKVLDIYEQKEITTYLNYSLPLCVFLKPEYNEWILDHFGNFYLMYSDNGYIWLDYLEELFFPVDVIEYQMIDSDSMKKISEFKAYLYQKIKSLHYIMLFLDEYYISCSQNYMTKHAIKQILVYGYDITQSEVYLVGFDNKNNFKKLIYNIDELCLAYNECLFSIKLYPYWVDKYNVILLKDKKNISNYKTNVMSIFRQIEDFLSSREKKEKLRPEIIVERGNRAYFGIQAQMELVNGFMKLYEDKFVLDYRYIHLLVEHKKMMLMKIKYLTCKTKNKKIEQLFSKYNILYSEFLKIKNVFMKNVILDDDLNSIYGQLKNKKIIIELHNKLICLSKNEKVILEELLNFEHDYNLVI